jgi:hypothetical protein
MLGIELTTGQKIQVALILVALGVAGFFVFKSTRPGFDSAINSWRDIKHFAANHRPVTKAAPEDPKLEETQHVFTCTDGKIIIIEYKNDPDKHPKIEFQPDKRLGNHTFVYYQDPLAPVAKIKDPFRHALAYATYYLVYTNPQGMGLLASASMTPDQAAKEKNARETMLSEIAFIKTGIDSGTYQSPLMDAVMKALKVYEDTKGEPMKDPAKAALAKKVLEAIATFESTMYKDEYKQIDKYIDVMTELLNKTQKDEFVKEFERRTAPRTPATTRRNAPTGIPTTRGGRGAVRGGATNPAGGGRAATAPAGG